MTKCVICGAEIKLGTDVMRGELVECAECGTELEVAGVSPIMLAEAPTEEEDWGQ